MSEPVLHIDVESRSVVDLKKAGAAVYFEHPTTDLHCAAWAIGDGPVQIWTPGQPCPDEVFDHVLAGGVCVAHNYLFERGAWRALLWPKYGWPEPRLEQWRCTLAKALAMALPGSLENAAAAVGLENGKDTKGRTTMLQLSRPRRIEPDGAIVWWDTPEKLERLYAYCKQDVEVERALDKRLLDLNPFEQKIFVLDGVINERGVFVDTDLCHAAKKIVTVSTKALDEEMDLVTGGAVRTCSQVGLLTEWLRGQGLTVESVAKDKIADLLTRDDIPEAARRALELRQEAAKTSTAKIDAFLTRRSADGRMRGNLQFHGAGTGRWAGRGAQLQNLPRPSTESTAEIIAMVEALSTGDADIVGMLYQRPLSVVSDCLRGMICAGPGNTLFSADFSAIEARGLAWLAGQQDVLQTFRDGVDIYNHAASGIFGRPIDRKKQLIEGAVGKVSTLALGYEGGVGAFLTMAKTYGLKIGDHFDAIWSQAAPEHVSAAETAFEQRGKGSGIAARTWLAAEVVKVAWRAANPFIVQLWRDLREAAIAAVKNPGETFQAGRYIGYRKVGSFLWCRLPSGRVLCYPYAEVTRKEAPWKKQAKDLIGSESEAYFLHGSDLISYDPVTKVAVFMEPATTEAIRYKCVDQFTRKWEWKDFYGGLAAENVTSAVCRDIMAEAMVRVEDAGYPVVLTVHDEIVSERELGGSLDEFVSLMSVVPQWATGFPIKAAGWTGRRYRK